MIKTWIWSIQLWHKISIHNVDFKMKGRKWSKNNIHFDWMSLTWVCKPCAKHRNWPIRLWIWMDVINPTTLDLHPININSEWKKSNANNRITLNANNRREREKNHKQKIMWYPIPNQTTYDKNDSNRYQSAHRKSFINF